MKNDVSFLTTTDIFNALDVGSRKEKKRKKKDIVTYLEKYYTFFEMK